LQELVCQNNIYQIFDFCDNHQNKIIKVYANSSLHGSRLNRHYYIKTNYVLRNFLDYPNP